MKNKNFVIFKINDRAIDNVLDIRKKLSEFKEINFESFDANKNDINLKLNQMNLTLNNWEYTKVGEVGVWITNLLFLKKMIEEDVESSLCFEDDAILSDNFYEKFLQIQEEAPEDYDFVTMVYPKSSISMYKEDANLEFKNVCLAKYNYFGLQCILWSKKGAKRFLDLVNEDKISNPIDIVLYEYVKKENLKGISVRPDFEQVVFHDLSRYKSVIDPKKTRGTLAV
jgi:GR25 family glycosyltransferase involved in LPS biosynthesis